ncbi:phosphoribosyltransferase family protein [Photobacterium nomapromontoriensis]|uniref:phosphoribosyltransferase family protein n=1 Tax=Photobacterium nomapromontoriensis TaxID=2910237 RepID=UPI003D0D6689
MVSLLSPITNFLRRYHRCQLCQLPVADTSIGNKTHMWCHDCLSRFPRPPYCHRCGRTTLSNTAYCGHCLVEPPPWQHLYRVGEYHFPLRQLIHQFKFGRQFWLAQPLADMLVSEIVQPAPVILPVPLHPLRRFTRGFNQSTLLADAIAKQTASRCQPSLLRRQRYTRPQHMLNKSQRQQNLDQAFILKKQALPKHVAIVDDVVTTGSTVAAITTLLQQHGVEKVDIYCICYTPTDL